MVFKKLLFIILIFPLSSYPFEKDWDKKGLEKIMKKDYGGALKIYETAYKIYPNYPPILQNLANLYIFFKKEKEALEILKKLVKIDKTREYGFKTLRILLYKNEKEREWLPIVSRWYIETKSEKAFKALVGARIRIKHFSQALKLMEKKNYPLINFEPIKNLKKLKEIVFLITLDTFRYDVLKEQITPNLWNFKKECYSFENAFAVTPITLPSHTSILTGLYPAHTGVRDNSIYKLKEEAETIPEILKNYGFESYGFISSFLLNRKFGINQGFKFYQDNFLPLDKKSHFPSTRRAEDTLKEALKYLKNIKGEKTFFFIHLYDPHAPYEPPFPFDEAYPENLYLGEVAYLDFVLGKFFDFLKKSKIYEKSTIFLLADHGEALGEKGEPTHGFLLYNSTLKIPFLIHLKKQKKGFEIYDLASQVDLLPTLLYTLKIPYKKLDGVNLFNLKNERKIFSETELPLSFRWSPLYKVYFKEFSYISSPSQKCFNFLKDPKEKKDLKDKKIINFLKEELENYKKEKPLWETSQEVLDEETLKNLKSLGYHQSFIGNKREEKLPNPEEKMEILVLYQKAVSLEEENNFELLYEITKEIEKREGENPQFLNFYAEWYYKMGKEKESLDAIEKALRLDPNFAQGYFYLGFLKENYNVKEAEKNYKKALELEPKHFLARYNLSRIYLIEEKFDEGEEEMKKVLKVFPEHAYTLNNLGYLYFKRDKNCSKAIEFIERANKLKDDETLKISLITLLCNCGKKEKAKEVLIKFKIKEKKIKEFINCK